MKAFTTLGLVASLFAAVEAHTSLVGIYVDDVKQGDGTCVRMTKNKSHPVDPVEDIMSDDMACSFNGETPAAFTCPVSAGSKLTFEYRSKPDEPRAGFKGQGFIDPGHLGPAAVHAKQLSSPDASAAGDGWFKLWEDGYDVDTDTWAMTKLIEDQGLISVKVPEGLPAGNYLFRVDLIALHTVENDVVKPQFFPGCAQVFIESPINGTLNIPKENEFSVPGYIQPGEKSMTYNIYQRNDAYPLPGPDKWVPPVPANAMSNDVERQTEGGVPNDCLLKNANFCFKEVASYSDQEGCWDSNSACWKQVDACWAAAPITGGRNCEVGGTKCKDIDAHCSRKDWNGPPKFNLESNDWPAYKDIPAPLNAGDKASTVEAPVQEPTQKPTKTQDSRPTATQTQAEGNGDNNAQPTQKPTTATHTQDTRPTATQTQAEGNDDAQPAEPTKKPHGSCHRGHGHKKRRHHKH